MNREFKQIKSNLSMEKGRTEIQKELTASCSDMLSFTSDVKTRNIAGILIKRQNDDLKMLDAVVTSEQECSDSKKAKDSILYSPAFTKLFACLSLCLVIQSAVSNNWNYAILSSAILACQTFLMARNQSLKDRKPIVETRIDMDKARSYLETAQAMIRQQVNEIELIFSTEAITSAFDLYETVSEQYIKLYEAHLDRPENCDIEYALTLSKQLLLKTGLEAVPYSDENSRFFIEEKADFPSQMRYPAVRRKDNGAVIVCGLYILNTYDDSKEDR